MAYCKDRELGGQVEEDKYRKIWLSMVMGSAIIGPDESVIIKGTDMQGIFELARSDHSYLVKR